ncbi:MAG TPA: hypothetical protein VKE22_30915, partial [Haliangiales bacterium]|nr:hypothetical protein [Haliangiales bacterium]
PRLGPRVLRLGAALGLAAAVVFGGNGMHPRDVVRILDLGWGARACVWLVWLVPVAHAARSIWEAPDAHYLRTLPLGRRALLWVPAVLLIAVEAPWAILFGLGAGPVAALRAGAAAAGAHALLFAGVRGARDAVAAATLVAAMVLPWTPGAPATAAPIAAALAAGAAVLSAWDRAPERRRPRLRRWVRGPITANLAAMVRQEGALLWRALFLVGTGGGIAALAARNNDVTATGSQVRLALAVGAVTLTAALAGPAAATLRLDERDGWLLDLAGAPLRRRRGAAAAATAGVGAVAGALHGLAAAPGSPRVVAAAAAFGALLGAWTAGALWRAGSFERMLGAMLATAVAAAIAFALAGEIALAPLAVLAALSIS